MRFLHRNEIDTEKWDKVIAQSPAETLYPYSWYLDAVADNWSALILDDYRFIMPLVWKKKYGMKYVYQPFYTQQLGVFSKEYVDPTVITDLLSVVRKKYRFASINFNIKNLVGEQHPFTVEDKSNYVLELKPAYDDLFASFSTNAKRNIKKAYEIDEVVETDTSCDELLKFKRKNDVIKRSEEDYRWLANLMDIMLSHQAGRLYTAKSDGKLSAAAFFAFSRTRAIYLLSASSERGKDERGMFKIVDTFIREHAGSDLILDFEGSNIPTVARFFGGFGARPEIYQGVSFSRLPLFLNRLRKYG